MGSYKNTRLKPKLTPNQINGFKSLLSKRDTISFSVSDKGGAFVVMNKDSQRQLTEYYHRSSTDVSKYVEPTRVNQGGICPVINPTVVSYKRQIEPLTVKLQEKCNNLWKTICKRCNLDDFVTRAFMSSNTQLPVMYILLKTHTFDVCQIINATDINQICKVRPIVSCVSSPMEKLAWLCTYILTPLLRFIPCHLNDIFQHLDNLSLLKPEQLAGKYFWEGVKPHFCPWKKCVFSHFSPWGKMGKKVYGNKGKSIHFPLFPNTFSHFSPWGKWEKKYMEREGKVFISFSFHILFSHGKKWENTFFHGQKWGWTPPPPPFL